MTVAAHDKLSVLTTGRGDMCYCPGCSHAAVLEHLGRAIDEVGLRHEDVCIVSDIGCIGTADKYFKCHTFHGLHGRSFTYAEGIKRFRPEMTVIVLVGDGGCGIGTAHLVHAARRNAGIKVIVCNNFNFGMTGGQHSPTTPTGMLTVTTPGGAEERPFDVCQTVIANGAAHVGRFNSLDSACSEHIAAVLLAPGFGLLDLWELCVAYFVPGNKLKPTTLAEISERFNLPFGLLHTDDRPAPRPKRSPRILERGQQLHTESPASAPLPWPRRIEICVAGSAGQRIRSAVSVIGEIAVAGGLFAAQLDDFPITVRKGHSISYLILSAEPIRYTGVDDPDLVILLSGEGSSRLGSLSHLKAACRVIADRDIGVSATPAAVHRIDYRQFEMRAGKASAALVALTAGLVAAGWVNANQLLCLTKASLQGKYREDNLRAIERGISQTPDDSGTVPQPAQERLP